MKNPKRRAPALLMILAATAVLSAQQPPAQAPKKPPQVPTFRSATDASPRTSSFATSPAGSSRT